MKALVLKEYRDLVYEVLLTPEAGVDDMFIRGEACGIRGSDLRGYHGSACRRIRATFSGGRPPSTPMCSSPSAFPRGGR